MLLDALPLGSAPQLAPLSVAAPTRFLTGDTEPRTAAPTSGENRPAGEKAPTLPIDLTISAMRARAFWVVASVYVTLILCTPLAAGALLCEALGRVLPAALAFGLAAPVVALLFALVPALLSLPHQRWIVPAKMPTNVGIRAYFHRRLYGLCWTSLYYNQFVYWFVLSFPWLKITVFRLFGYRGAARFTVYPDTWIRDLPLLRIGKGAYLSNKATIGTNMIFQNGDILVDEVEIGAGTVVGHLACLAPGARCEQGSQVGVGAFLGLRARLGAQAQLGGASMVDHGARIGDRTTVDPGSYVGSATVLGADLYVPAMTSVRARARVRTQADLAANLGSRSAGGDAGSKS